MILYRIKEVKEPDGPIKYYPQKRDNQFGDKRWLC